MERWLTLALAERLGIWSNPSFPFPRAVIEQVLEGLSLGASVEARAYEPDRLKWTIAELLRESAPAKLKAYLGEPSDADRVLRLAASVSVAFDDYVVYRPQVLARWDKGKDHDWQADLWRRVVERLGPHDLASRITRAVTALGAGHATDGIGFERLHLFSLETLPPLFLELFSAVSRSIPTTFYLLEPSSEYLSDLGTTPQLPAGLDDTPGDGHQLFSTLGRLARDFQQLLLAVDHTVHHEADLFQAPDRTNLLSSLQADILEFRSPPEDGERQTIEASDGSISLHACTGPMREAQVLHDLIRAALEDDQTLRPEDIVVMTPDLEAYAPAFRAVFGQDEQRRIPYEVHDRKTRDDAPFYDDFLAVLEVLDSRFSVLDLLRLMDADSLREDFRFTQDERSRLAELLAAAGVRWGIDAEHRAELEFPPEPLHTWRAGLGRLFLGFASAPDSTNVFEGSLPRGAPSLGDAELVARLARLCELLFDFQRRTREPLHVDAWVREVQRLSSSLFAEDDERSAGVRILRSTLDELGALASLGGYRGAITLKTLRRELEAMLIQKAPAIGFLRRGVTLTELVPLRSVPFRVVCLVGMSEDEFPRADKRPSFDIMVSDHEPGDRNKRDDDRHSFLQAILCARDRLIITYSAPATSSKSATNPSPVVWELREAARRYYALPSDEPVLEPTAHPLHPFDPRYFEVGELPQSASQRYLEIARALEKPSVEPVRVELRAVTETEEESLSVSELSAWLWNPISAFIEKVLRARFGVPALYEPASALTELGRFEAAIIGNEALEAGLRDEALEAYLRAAPEFPDGTWGSLERQRIGREIRIINARKALLEPEQQTHSEFVATKVEGLTLEGRLDGLYPEQRILKRFTHPGKRTELTVWIEHLLMQTVEELPTTTQLVLRGTETRASLVSFGPVADARARLAVLIDLYRSSREAPLPLLEKPSRVFAEKLGQTDSDKAFAAAKNELDHQRKWDRYLSYVFGADDPFDEQAWRDAFEAAAIRLYEPLFQHRSEE
jgi:exodeoxyribonuclease V gamma subunit